MKVVRENDKSVVSPESFVCEWPISLHHWQGPASRKMGDPRMLDSALLADQNSGDRRENSEFLDLCSTLDFILPTSYFLLFFCVHRPPSVNNRSTPLI